MEKKRDLKNLLLEIWKAKYMYLFILPVIVNTLIFKYGPMYGILMAFKDYKARLGIWGSEWVGLKHFERIFIVPDAVDALINTIVISLQRIVFQFPVPIILALMLTEMRGKRLKRVYQTVLTFPNFLSWVVVGVILTNFFSYEGAVNSILAEFGLERISFFGNKAFFRPMLYITGNWKDMGWSAIIYLAAIAGIDPTLYDAAKVDGASRLQQIWHITLPSIKQTIVVLFILNIGSTMDAGFDQIFVLKNPLLNSVAQILDTYIYDITFKAVPDYGFSTAVGLFKTVVNVILVVSANKVVKKINGQGLFG